MVSMKNAPPLLLGGKLHARAVQRLNLNDLSFTSAGFTLDVDVVNAAVTPIGLGENEDSLAKVAPLLGR